MPGLAHLNPLSCRSLRLLGALGEHIDQRAWPASFRVGLAFRPEFRGLFLPLLPLPAGGMRLARQGSAGRLHRVVLHVKEVRRVVRAQARFRLGNEGLGRIAGHLADGDRQRGKLRAGTLLPGLGITLRLVLFDEDEVRHRFDGHQADLRMKGLVLAEGNLAGRHRRGEPLVFLLAETDQKRLQFLGDRLLGSIGGSDECIQAAKPEKPTQVAQPAIAGLDEDQMGGREQPVEKVQTLGGFQKPRHRFGTGTALDQRPLPPDPLAQGPRRHVQLACDAPA